MSGQVSSGREAQQRGSLQTFLHSLNNQEWMALYWF